MRLSFQIKNAEYAVEGKKAIVSLSMLVLGPCLFTSMVSGILSLPFIMFFIPVILTVAVVVGVYFIFPEDFVDKVVGAIGMNKVAASSPTAEVKPESVEQEITAPSQMEVSPEAVKQEETIQLETVTDK